MTQTSAHPSDPGPGDACRVCGKALPASLTCTGCGAAYGEANRCPHCHAVAGTEPGGTLLVRCRICGGPRVPVTDPAVVRTGREIPLLKRVERSRIAAGAWRAGAWLAGLFGAASLVIALSVLALVQPSPLTTALSVVFAAIPLPVAFVAAARARKLRAQQGELLDRAWALVASDVIAGRETETSPAELAAVLGIDEARAETLLAQLSAQDLVSARVTRDGDLVYETKGMNRVRVQAGEGSPEEENDERAAAEPNVGHNDAMRARVHERD